MKILIAIGLLPGAVCLVAGFIVAVVDAADALPSGIVSDRAVVFCAVVSLAWMIAVFAVPGAWLFYRRHSYHEDVLWWIPLILQKRSWWLLYGGFAGMAFIAVATIFGLVGGHSVPKTTGLWWLTALAVFSAFQTVPLRRKFRAMSEPHCWNCFYNVSHIHPDSDACPECGFSVSESISRWQVCPEAFRPKWVTEGEGTGEQKPHIDPGMTQTPGYLPEGMNGRLSR